MENIKLSNRIEDILNPDFKDWWAHVLCTHGSCNLKYIGEEMTLDKGSLLITGRTDLLDIIKSSDDLEVVIIFITRPFLALSIPSSNYGMRGQLALFLNPLMILNKEQFDICKRDFDNLIRRFQYNSFTFFEEMMINSVQLIILDFFEFHSSIYKGADNSSQLSLIINRFIEILETGAYRRNRNVSYYAERLFITPKHLSAVCNQITGRTANFWINRYTAVEISRDLRNKNISLLEISDKFGFSNLSHFSRFVLQHLGQRPSHFRD